MSEIANRIAAKNRIDRKMEIAKLIFDRTHCSIKPPTEQKCQSIAEEILALGERFYHAPKAPKGKNTK